MDSISIQPFKEAYENTETVAAEAAKGRRVIGYLCNYTPVELIHACGFIPFRITGGPGPLDRAYDLLPDFICPFLKRIAERAMNKEFDFISGIVQGYTCDAACGVVKVLENNMNGSIFEVIPFPYEDSMDSRMYFRNMLTSLKDKLQSLGGSFSDKALDDSGRLYERIRQIIDKLYEIRYSGRLPINAGELWYVVRAGERTLPEAYLDMLESLMEQVERLDTRDDRSDRPDRNQVPLLLSGSLVEDIEIYNVIEDCGGRVVADDLCTGLRTVGAAVESEKDPLERLVSMHYRRIPCPARARAEERLAFLLDIIERSSAAGVLFLHQKFCTPHLSDFPHLSSELKENGIKSIQIEMDETWKASGQFRTRMESFFEMLRD